MRRSDASEAGYGLVEVLVVLALVSILAATMMSATGQFGSLLRLDRKLEARLVVQRVAGHIANLLQSAETLPILDQLGEMTDRMVLSGGPDRVRFFATTRLGSRTQGLREITIRVDGAADQRRLMQEMAPRRIGSVSLDRKTIELANEIVELAFAYYGPQNDGAPAAWQDHWENSTELPLAISVRISTRSNGEVLSASTIASIGEQ